MPQYVFKCREDLGGCGHEITFTCLMSELNDQRPKACPECRKRKSIQQVLFPPSVNVPHTLGTLAERNTQRLSEDERHHLSEEHNKYKKDRESSWIPTPDGMVHK